MTRNPDPELEPGVVEAALYGLNYALGVDKGAHDPLIADDKGRIVRIVAHHAFRASHRVPWDEHQAALKEEQAKTDRWKDSWASVVVQSDARLGKMQRVLSALPDRVLAERIAAEVGVLLLPIEESV